MPIHETIEDTKGATLWRSLREKIKRPLLVDADKVGRSIFSLNAACLAFGKEGWISTKDAIPPEYELTYVYSFIRQKTRCAWREGWQWKNPRGDWSILETSWQRIEIDHERYEI